MALGLAVAADIASAALTFYTRGEAFLQTIQDKPLLRELTANKKTFPSGKDNVSDPIQGAFMSSTAGFFAGYSEDDQLAFKQAANLLRAEYPWKELHAGLIMTETELKKDGISVTDSMETHEHSSVELTRLTGLLENRLADFGESWARSMNDMLWRDGSQDAKAIPGMQAILTPTPTVGSTGGLSRATYTYWRHRQSLGIAQSDTDQTLTRTLRTEVRQLRRYGGKPRVALCGSAFLDALEFELTAKGSYTVEGFAKGTNEIGVSKISLRGLGTFDYDPTLDDLGLNKYCYIWDPSHIVLRPMEGEENKVRNPERPYDYFIFLRSMTYTGALACNQLNCNGVYSIA